MNQPRQGLGSRKVKYHPYDIEALTQGSESSSETVAGG